MKTARHLLVDAFRGLLAALLVSGIVYWLLTENQLSNLAQEAESRGEFIEGIFKGNIADKARKLLLISNNENVAQFLFDGDEASLRKVRELAYALSQIDADLDQVRVLDASGMEVLRVNYPGSLVPENQLQDKSDTSYFQETIELDAGAVYLSQLDFNKEFGVKEYPLRQMLRLSTPIRAENGEFLGAAVLNVDMSRYLERLKTIFTGKTFDVEIFDSRDSLAREIADRESAGNTGHGLGEVMKESLVSGKYAKLPMAWRLIDFDGAEPIRNEALTFKMGTSYYMVVASVPLQTFAKRLKMIRNICWLLFLVIGVVVSSALYISRMRRWERKIARLKLQKSEANFHHIFESTPVSVWHQDWTEVLEMIEQEEALKDPLQAQKFLEENEDFVVRAEQAIQILDVNSKAVEVFEAGSKAELLGSMGKIFSTPDAKSTLAARLLALAQGKKEFETEMKVKKVSGEMMDVMLRMSIAGEKANSGRVVACIIDVTEEKRMRDQILQQNSLLDESNKDLEKFAYVASHDLQEPLRMVSSYLQLVERRYAEKLDKDGKEFIEYAVDGAKRMQLLINDLLAFSRVSRKKLEMVEVDLNALLEVIIRDLSARIEESGGEIKVGDLPSVMGDQGQLGQLFTNVVGNALKFSREESPKVSVTAERQGEFVQVEVRDNGVGIDPKYVERVFEVFQRLHGREEFEGTGIGLAISKKIVERHGGKISIAPNPDVGATVRMTFLSTEALQSNMERTNVQPQSG